MSQEQEGFQSLTKTSTGNTKIVSRTEDEGDRNLVVLSPKTLDSKIDDKAAALENTIECLKAELRKERFVYIFIIISMFDGLMLSTGNEGLFLYFLFMSLIILIGLANWLEFPWVVVNLEKFLNRAGKSWDKWLGIGDDSKIEP